MGLQTVLSVAVVALGLLCSQAEADEVFIALRPVVTVDKATVRLGDIADVSTRNPLRGDQYKQIEVRRLTSLATPQRIVREDVLTALGQRKDTAQDSVIVGGGNFTSIAGRPIAIDITPGIDLAAKQIMDRFGGRRGLVIRVVEGGEPLLGFAGATRMTPDMSALRRFGRFIDLPLTIETDGVLVARPILRFELTPAADVAGDEVMAAPDATGTERVLRPDVESRQGASDAHRRDSDYPERDRQNWLIRKNQRVRLIVEAGSVRLEGKGVALADAHGGDSITVQYQDSGATLAGRAVGPGQVLVQEN